MRLTLAASLVAITLAGTAHAAEPSPDLVAQAEAACAKLDNPSVAADYAKARSLKAACATKAWPAARIDQTAFRKDTAAGKYLNELMAK